MRNPAFIESQWPDEANNRLRVFPTFYQQDYPTDYAWCGTLSTTISGLATCITHPCAGNTNHGIGSESTVFTLPSHPPIPPRTRDDPVVNDPVVNDPVVTAGFVAISDSDPQGLTYEADWAFAGDWELDVQPIFPDLGFWNCSRPNYAAPARLKMTALYLTATSIVMDSYTSSDLPTNFRAPAISPGHVTSLPAKEAVITPDVTSSNAPISSHIASASAEAAIKPPDVTSGNFPISNDVVEATTTPGASDSQQMFSELPANAVTASLQVAHDKTSAPVAHLTATPEYFSSEQFRSHPAATVPSPMATPSQSVMLLAVSPTPSDRQRSQLATLLPFWEALTQSEEASIVSNHQTMPQDAELHKTSSGQTLGEGSSIHFDPDNAAIPIVVQTFNSRTVLVVGASSSIVLLRPTLDAAADTTIILDDHVLTANTEGVYMVGTQTLSPGSSITIGSGTAATQVQLQTSDDVTVLVAGSVTSTLERTVSAAQALTIGSQVVVADSKGQYVVGSSTLTPGDAITLTGTSVSPAPSTSRVVVGTSTEGLGGQIINGLGSGPTSSASSAPPIAAAAVQQVQALGVPVILCMGLSMLLLLR